MMAAAPLPSLRSDAGLALMAPGTPASGSSSSGHGHSHGGGGGGHGHSHGGGGGSHGHSHGGGGEEGHHGHSHSHGHGHGHDDDDHGHSHSLLGSSAGSKAAAVEAANKRARWQLIAAMVFCFVFMAAEVVGGYLAHSLAIMTEYVVVALICRRRRCCRSHPNTHPHPTHQPAARRTCCRTWRRS